MSSAGAVLYYGFYLGCPDGEGWKIEEVRDGGEFKAQWLNLAGDDGDYATAMTLLLLARKSIPIDSPDRLETLLAKSWGVRIVVHGHQEKPHYGLAVVNSAFECNSFTPSMIAPNVGSTVHLRPALEVLGMSPLQYNPTWILAPRVR